MVTFDQKILVPVPNEEPVLFRFEKDFVEQNIRCIPMIVRFKLDIVAIKLKLVEWSRFSSSERKSLIDRPCVTEEEIDDYRLFLKRIIREKTGKEAATLPPELHPPWAELENISDDLKLKAAEFSCALTDQHWKALNNLQRFALIKLCRPGHENRNFPKALKEFGLM